METNQTSYLTQLVYWNGYGRFEYTPIFIDLSKRVNTFWDIGANIGYYSLIAAAVNPSMKIIAFEPAPEPLHFLKKNVALNGFQHIHVESTALSDQNGMIDFYEIKNKKYTYLKHNLAGEGNAGSKTIGRNFSKTTVQATTANEFRSTFNQPVDLIKIDTEGTEHLILEKASLILQNDRPIVICETLFNKIEGKLEEIMKGHGYQFYNHVGKGLSRVDSIKRSSDDGVLNCFFVHPDKIPWIESYLN